MMQTSPVGPSLKFLDISYDILENVFYQINRCKEVPKEFANIRLVCRRLNEMVEPWFFRDMVINCASHSDDAGSKVKAQLAALSTKQCAASRYTKRLTILSLSPDPYKDRLDIEEGGGRANVNHLYLDEHVKSALDTLTNLRRVSWHLRSTDPYQVVIASLSALPLLKDVRITFEGQTPHPFCLSLNKFSGLETIALCNNFGKIILPAEIIDELAEVIANSPLLSHLEIGVHFSKSSVSFHDFLRLIPKQGYFRAQPALTHLALDSVRLCISNTTTLPFLRSLTSLDISTSPGEYNSNLWESLKEANIHLSDVKSDIVTSTLIDYLTSYSSLRKLTLNLRMVPSDGAVSTSKEAYDLFHLVLPKHGGSLIALFINARSARRWAFRPDYLSPLHTCQKLVELGLSMDFKEGDEGDVESFGVTDIVASAVHFRQLSILQIYPAGIISVWGCGTGRLRYHQWLQKNFTDSLASFKISDPERYLFQVIFFGNVFKLLPDPVEAGKYRYTHPAADIYHSWF